MPGRKPERTAMRWQAANAEPAATVTSRRRRVIALGTFSSRDHLDDGARMQGHHDEVNEREESEKTEADQMDGAGAIVAAEERFEPPELDGLVDRQAREDFDQRDEDDGSVCQPLKAVVEVNRRCRPAEM